MPGTLRGADLVARALSAAGTERIFTLSGNQIMPIFDACIDAGIELVHVRHEAAAVHMADAWGRLTGRPGVALVTAGPGLANSLSALYVATMAESPMILLSGHAPREELGRGAFQEMAQAEMAEPVAKASWTAAESSELGRDVVRALGLAGSGRPGPVHVGLPVDLLESSVEDRWEASLEAGPLETSAKGIDTSAAKQVVDALARARRPLVLAGPAMMRGAGPKTMSALAALTHVPVASTESPRGTGDPALGAFAQVLPDADLVLLLGKKLDFTLQFGDSPSFSKSCRFIQVDADEDVLGETRKVLGSSRRLALAQLADPLPAARRLIHMAEGGQWPSSDWHDEVQAAISYRPPEWATLESAPGGPLHAVEVCRGIRELLDAEAEAVFISDGGEFGQWAQTCVAAPHRVINGPAGSIGSAIPFALAARLAYPRSRVVAVLGDGTFGFHALEFDTAVRYQLPFVAVVGNDAAWNAEYQIQLRKYGTQRLVGCELLPSRYDEVAQALGGHGGHAATANELRPALQDAVASGRPACVNVMIERNAAPVIQRPAS